MLQKTDKADTKKTEKAVKKVDKVINTISNTVAIVSYIALVGIMVLITVDVLLRKIIQVTVVGSYEIVQLMLLLLVFGAFAYAQTNRSHIHVTMFIAMMPRQISMVLFGLWGVLSTGTAVLCGYALILQGFYAQSAGTWTPVLYIPLYPFNYIAAFCMFIFALTLLWDTIKSFIGVVNEEVAKDISSSWS